MVLVETPDCWVRGNWYYHNFSLALHTGLPTSDSKLREMPNWVLDSPVWLVVCQETENPWLLLLVSSVNSGVCVQMGKFSSVGKVWTLVLCPCSGNRGTQDYQAPEMVGCLYEQWKKKWAALLISIHQKKLSNTKHLALPLTLSPRHILSAWTWPSIT